MLVFRNAQSHDGARIAALEKAYIECPWSEAVVCQTIDDELSTIYLLTDGDEILGYGGLKMVFDTAEVYNIVVDEKYRRHGYGTLVLEKLFEHAVEHGAREMFLEVNENNVAAINLYTAHGFRISHMRKDYYKSGNALILKREI